MLTEKRKKLLDGVRKKKKIYKGKGKRERERERKTIASHEARSQVFHSSSRGTTMDIIVIFLTVTGLENIRHI